jgi:putative NADH-flavin reductase
MQESTILVASTSEALISFCELRLHWARSKETTMRILIIGATGPTGLQLINEGLSLGHEITAAVRNPQAATLPQGVRVVRADVMDPPSMLAATTAQEAVISSLGSKIDRKPTTLFSQGTRNLIAGMNLSGVKRLVCITGIGAGDSKGHGGFLYDRLFHPFLLDEIYIDKTRQEEEIRCSNLDWTIVRPGRLTNGPRTMRFRQFDELTGVTVGKISRADVAYYIMTHIADKSSFSKTATLTY